MEAAAKPNILFIAMDDLNDWVGCLGGHPQARTPNLDRLAASGILFSNAHCAAPSCNPSRTAIFTGLSPHRSGIYRNNQKMREALPTTEILPKTFSRAGYWAGGSGKMLHYFIDARSWDEYFPKKETESPFPRTLYPKQRPVSIPREPWQYVETDWAALDATDEEYGGDFLVAKWVSEKLSKKHDQPFFLACGIYRPHEPWFVPKKYFDPFPLDKTQLPPGYKADDLEDLPPEGKRRGPNRYFAHIRKHKQWKPAVQAYLASIYFADTMLGHVLDALGKGPNAGNTIVVLWSDHGWHLGEKQHWQKFTAWRASTRVPLIVRVPKGAPGLPSGTKSAVCVRPVSLLSLAPTLLQLSGLPPHKNHHGPSLVPLLKNPKDAWPHTAVTHLDQPGSFALSAERFRYIHYASGGEELYDTKTDPYEWRNLANDKQHAATLKRLRALAPTKFAKAVAPKITSMPALKWNPLGANTKTPTSKPAGGTFDVIFINSTSKPVQLFWMTPNGGRKHYVTLPPGKQRRQSTRPGAIWQIAGGPGANAKPFGYFKVGDRTAKAVVPEEVAKK
ncbi:MAG: sulfatase-like hydrolase/transferase [Verrucomicrobiales bacterium]|nr:sulfatase-like hydrolase/transferase [Verrucomicrobiales bacterium]